MCPGHGLLACSAHFTRCAFAAIPFRDPRAQGARLLNLCLLGAACVWLVSTSRPGAALLVAVALLLPHCGLGLRPSGLSANLGPLTPQHLLHGAAFCRAPGFVLFFCCVLGVGGSCA